MAQIAGPRGHVFAFEPRTGTGTGHVSDEGDTSVEMISIDEAVREGLLRVPTAIKLDVEGAENLVLDGGMETITEHKPKMILAVHSDELEAYCRGKLEPLGYTFEDLGQEKGDKEFIVTAG